MFYVFFSIFNLEFIYRQLKDWIPIIIFVTGCDTIFYFYPVSFLAVFGWEDPCYNGFGKTLKLLMYRRNLCFFIKSFHIKIIMTLFMQRWRSIGESSECNFLDRLDFTFIWYSTSEVHRSNRLNGAYNQLPSKVKKIDIILIRFSSRSTLNFIVSKMV